MSTLFKRNAINVQPLSITISSTMNCYLDAISVFLSLFSMYNIITPLSPLSIRPLLYRSKMLSSKRFANTFFKHKVKRFLSSWSEQHHYWTEYLQSLLPDCTEHSQYIKFPNGNNNIRGTKDVNTSTSFFSCVFFGQKTEDTKWNQQKKERSMCNQLQTAYTLHIVTAKVSERERKRAEEFLLLDVKDRGRSS